MAARPTDRQTARYELMGGGWTVCSLHASHRGPGLSGLGLTCLLCIWVQCGTQDCPFRLEMARQISLGFNGMMTYL